MPFCCSLTYIISIEKPTSYDTSLKVLYLIFCSYCYIFLPFIFLSLNTMCLNVCASKNYLTIKVFRASWIYDMFLKKCWPLCLLIRLLLSSISFLSRSSIKEMINIFTVYYFWKHTLFFLYFSLYSFFFI